MADQALSRELALRIGLAAKALPDVDARELLTVLVNRLGTPLTDKKLREITVTDLHPIRWLSLFIFVFVSACSSPVTPASSER